MRYILSAAIAVIAMALAPVSASAKTWECQGPAASCATAKSSVAKGKVAKALLPVRHAEARLRLHVDVHRQKVIAAMRAVRGDVLQEKLSGEPLADEPPENVREGDDDGVDEAALDVGLEGGEVHGKNPPRLATRRTVLCQLAGVAVLK